MFGGFYLRRCYGRPKSDCTVEKKQPGAYWEPLQIFSKLDVCWVFPTPLGLNTEVVTNRGSTKLVLYNFGQNTWKYQRKIQFCCKVACCRSGLQLSQNFTLLQIFFKNFGYSCRTALVQKRFWSNTILECFCKQY